MKLDNRLSAVASLVNKCDCIADIGTDHAYLPVYLIGNNKARRAVAADVRKGPLDNARKTVSQYGLEDKIELRLSDGLNSFKEGEVREIAVCGMGGHLIADFIRRTAWLKSPETHLVLQPMTHAEDLRKTLFDNGFYIDREVAAADGDKLYIALSAYYSGRVIEYSKADCVLGSLVNNSDELSRRYILKTAAAYEKKLAALKAASKNTAELEKLVLEIHRYIDKA